MAKAVAPEVVRKITTATLFDKKPRLNEGETSRHLYNVAGVARKYEKGEGTYGEWTRFKGEFLAVLPDGKKFKSSALFLPGMVEGELEVACDAANGGEVQFAFAIGIKEDAKAATGYVYTVRPIVKIEESDAMKKLESALENAAEGATIEAPKTDKKK